MFGSAGRYIPHCRAIYRMPGQGLEVAEYGEAWEVEGLRGLDYLPVWPAEGLPAMRGPPEDKPESVAGQELEDVIARVLACGEASADDPYYIIAGKRHGVCLVCLCLGVNFGLNCGVLTVGWLAVLCHIYPSPALMGL